MSRIFVFCVLGFFVSPFAAMADSGGDIAAFKDALADNNHYLLDQMDQKIAAAIKNVRVAVKSPDNCDPVSKAAAEKKAKASNDCVSTAKTIYWTTMCEKRTICTVKKVIVTIERPIVQKVCRDGVWTYETVTVKEPIEVCVPTTVDVIVDVPCYKELEVTVENP